MAIGSSAECRTPGTSKVFDQGTASAKGRESYVPPRQARYWDLRFNMTDTASILDVLAHVTTIIAFLVFIVPGFLSLRAFEAKHGGVSRKISEWLVDVVIFSFATDIVAVPIVYLTLQLDSLPLRVATSVVASVLGFIVLPIWLGIAWHHIQMRLAKDGHLADPTAKPWDKMFARIREEKLDVGIIITLPDGRKLGGRYIPPGFASHYPADEQLPSRGDVGNGPRKWLV